MIIFFFLPAIYLSFRSQLLEWLHKKPKFAVGLLLQRGPVSVLQLSLRIFFQAVPTVLLNSYPTRCE